MWKNIFKLSKGNELIVYCRYSRNRHQDNSRNRHQDKIKARIKHTIKILYSHSCHLQSWQERLFAMADWIHHQRKHLQLLSRSFILSVCVLRGNLAMEFVEFIFCWVVVVVVIRDGKRQCSLPCTAHAPCFSIACLCALKWNQEYMCDVELQVDLLKQKLISR